MVLVKSVDHEVQELDDVLVNSRRKEKGAKTSFKCSRATLSLNLTLTQTTAIPVTICFRTSCAFVKIPTASRIWTVQKKSSVRENRLRIVWRTHHVDLTQFHFLGVIAGGTRSVEFVLKFLGVEQSPPGLALSDITCNHCKHDCSQSLLSQ